MDFDIESDGTVEQSRSRLFDVNTTACELVHVAVRWEGTTDEYWEEHKHGTDNDLKRTKQIIESKVRD